MTVAEVNGTPWDGPPGTTVEELVARWSPSADGIAVAVNGEVVPKSAWRTRHVAAGDRIEIVAAAAGG